ESARTADLADTEVEHFDVVCITRSIAQKDVSRLEVLVDDALGVSCGKRRGCLLDHAERNPCWQSTCAAKTVIQVFPLEKLHDQVGLTGVHDAEVERLDDVRKMSQPGRHLGLSAEKRDSLLVQRELARHDLESDLLVEM